MGYESDGSGFESSSEQIDASLSNDSIDTGNTEITESPEQYDFDESDVGEYIPEGELPEEDQEGSIETTKIPEMSDSGSPESGEFDEDNFDEGDIGEYTPEALTENIESSDDDIEVSYKESAELGDSAENDFDESDVGEYDPEIVEGKIDADAEVDGDNYIEHADADTEETPEISELGEDTDFIEIYEETEFDEGDFEGASEEVEFGEEIDENSDEDFDVENADVSESADSVFEDIDGSAESIDKSSEDTYEDAELNEWTTENLSDGTESNTDNPEEVDEDADFKEEGSECDDDDIESIEINSENTGEESSDFVEDVSEDTDESAESDEESTEDVGEGDEPDDEVNLEGEEDSDSDENLPEDAESDEDDTEVADERIESDEETSENGTENTESGGEKPEEENVESSDEESENIDENAEPNDETSEAKGENAESDSEVIEGTASDEKNVENEEENTEFDEEAYEGEEDNTESGEEALEDVDEDAESSENNYEDENETTENADEATESDNQDMEGASNGADPSGDSLECDNEDTESGEENSEDVDEDIESDDESSEKTDDGSEPSKEVPEGKSEDTESDNEAPEDISEKTEAAENILEDGDSEFRDENLENTDENAESDEEISEGEGIEFNEDAPEYIGEDTESSEEKLDNVDGDTELDGNNMDETCENVEPNGEAQESIDEAVAPTEEQEKRQTADKTGEKADSDGKNEGIVPDADKSQQEWHSFIGATEKERHGGVMAMGMGTVTSEVAAMRQEEIRQARNAETPDLHRGETASTLREGHEQTIIAATEDRLEDNQLPEMFREAQVETGNEKRSENDYVVDRSEEPSGDRESEEKVETDDGTDADPDQDAAGQIAQAAQTVAAGLAAGTLGGKSGGPIGSEGASNGSDEPPRGPSGAGSTVRTPHDHDPIEQEGSRVRVEIPLMNGHQLGPVPVGEALQFGQPLSQLQRLVNEVPIPTNEMQGDAALADMITRMGVPPVRLGFPGNTAVTMEDVRVFRKSRGLRWLRFGDRKSLILVDASKKTYVQELREVAEPGYVEHETELELPLKAADALTEAVEVSTEEFERNLENFDEIETAEYERQKKFVVCEEGLREKMETRLGDFTCHGVEHVKEVMSEGERYIDALEKAGVEISESLWKIYGVAAKYHDIGMADNVGMELARDLSEKVKHPDADFSRLEEYYNLDPNATLESATARTEELVKAAEPDHIKVHDARKLGRLQVSVVEAKAMAAELDDMFPDDSERVATEKEYRTQLAVMQDYVYRDLRSNHARRSAEYVLDHSNEFKERYGKNVNPRNVACAIMLHTKTNSGCGNLNALPFGMAEVEQLSVEEACSHLVADWNLNHGDRRVESTFSEADLKEIVFVASVLRTADNRRNGETATFTNGDSIVCEMTKKGLELYHGEEKDGTIVKKRKVRNDESVSIISAEFCTQFGEIRPENGNMVHVMRFNGLGTAPLEQGFAERRVIDYVGEVESGVFMSGEKSVNIIEVQVPGASRLDCARLKQEWTRLLQEFCEKDSDKKAKVKAVMQYYRPGRLRVVPADRKEESL